MQMATTLVAIINIHKNIYRDSNNMELIENIEEMNDKLLKIKYI